MAEKLSPENLNFEEFCANCENYDSEIGICSEIHENVQDYPDQFMKRCGGDFFIERKKGKSARPKKTVLQDTKESDKKKEKESVAGRDHHPAETTLTSKSKEREYSDHSDFEEIDGFWISTKFRTLLTWANIIIVVGWLFLILGITFLIVGVADIDEYDSGDSFVYIFGGVGSMAMGFSWILLGQFIACFVQIEKNTRGTFEILRQKLMDKRGCLKIIRKGLTMCKTRRIG